MIVGVGIASFIPLPPVVFGAFLFAAAFLITFGFYDDRRLLLAGFIVLGLTVGALRFAASPDSGANLAGKDLWAGMLTKVRQNFDDSLSRVLPEPEASLARGILVGRSASFPQELDDAMRKTSTLHLVAVSGYNISIVAMAIVSVLGFLTVSRRFSWLVASAGIALYTIFVGAPASAVRAAIMGILAVIGRHAGRISNARNALTLAAAAMVLHRPQVLRWDLGFQLSFLATIGIIWVSPRIARRFKLAEANIVTDMFSAQIMVAPWIFYKFGTITLLGMGANLLVMSLTPLAMFWSFLAGLGGIVFLPAGRIVAAIAYILLRYSFGVIQFFAGLPLSALSLPLPPIWAIAAGYGLIAYFFFTPNLDAKAG